MLVMQLILDYVKIKFLRVAWCTGKMCLYLDAISANTCLPLNFVLSYYAIASLYHSSYHKFFGDAVMKAL